MNRAALVLCCLLAGCAVAPPDNLSDSVWAARHAALANLNAWNLDGRIGVLTSTEGWHGSVFWKQRSAGYQIELVGPLGQGRTRIEGDAGGVRVWSASGETYAAADLDQLMERELGLPIPMTGLIYWVRGLPDPNLSGTVMSGDEQGRLRRLEQGGWVIEFTRYEPYLGHDLPTRIKATRGDLRVKLAIARWAPGT